MEPNEQSTKTLRKLIFLVAFTAIMLIASTYAWFSSQKNVSISGLVGEVNVAEGLQISLDAKSWSGTLDLSTLDIIDDAYTNVVINEATSEKVTHTNLKPTELLPVSTTGTATGIADLAMYRGINTDTVLLKDIGTVRNSTSETDIVDNLYSGYYAFDIFLQNSGLESTDTQNVTTEVLQLNSDSDVTIIAGGYPDVGLQNTVRVGFALYDGYADVTANQQTILAAMKGATISDVAIWEPNSEGHVQNIVTNNNLIKWDEGMANTYLGTERDHQGKFIDGDYVPTYALTSNSIVSGNNNITDIYDWRTTPAVAADAGKLAKQNTVATGETVTVTNLKSASDGTTNFEILKNTVVKLRVYVWLEGQDVDCTNYASHGGGIEVDIGLIKSTEEGTSGAGTEEGPYLPTGFSRVAGTDLDTGLVIQDGSGNEYVWVEVPQTTAVYQTAGLDVETFTSDEYTKIENDLHTYTSTYRNGTSYSDTYSGDDTSTGLTSTEYDNLKKTMLKSVYQNGGFYVGRYEVGITSSYRDYGNEYTTEHPTSETAVIQANAYPYNWVRCSQAQSLASSMASGGYTSSLMFGVQWDLMLKYLETKGATQAELNSDSTAWGNYYNSTYNITNASAKYNIVDAGLITDWLVAPYSKTAEGYTILSTGASSTFSKQNIYDIAGNMFEWTLEYTSNSSYPCAVRGGYCTDDGSDYPASDRSIYVATISYPFIGFRPSIY